MHRVKYIPWLWVFAVTLLGLVFHYGFNEDALANVTWVIAALPILIWLAVDIAKSLRRGDLGVDLIAALAIIGALLLDESLAAAVIALMYASGQSLEQYAANRAKRELTALLTRAPDLAERYANDALETVPVEKVKPKDRLLIKTGAVLPVDGFVSGTSAILDESSLTGESLPVTRNQGEAVSSGTLNIGPPFDLEVAHDVNNSAYAGIIRLVKEAQTGKAPFTRMADRYALWFIPLTLIVSGATWFFSGDPVRALAVLVVATPCPLILAAPIAIVSGISASARNGFLIKNGATLEALAQTQRIILDKTGTITTGKPRLVSIEGNGRYTSEKLLQFAASLEQTSFHAVSSSIVESAKQRNLSLTIPDNVAETPGSGLCGEIDSKQVVVGQPQWVLPQAHAGEWIDPLLKQASNEGRMLVLIAIDQQVVGALVLQDEVRTDTPRALRNLRMVGIQSLSMASGDQKEIAESIGFALGMNQVYGNLKPEDKVEIVRKESQQGTTLMVGDGINDAPALAIADIGVAMGASGASASSEAADAVLLVDRIEILADGVRIARRSHNIARQSVIIGMVLSVGAMLFASLGYLTPLEGAVLQEGIDVLVILNALRALRLPESQPSIIGEEQERKLQKEHVDLQPVLENIRQLADRLASHDEVRGAELSALAELLKQKLIPHEQEDERQLHPRLAQQMSGSDPMAMLSRTHQEILYLCRGYLNQLAAIESGVPDNTQRQSLARTLYSLGAILELHFAQENELYKLLATKRMA
ncbi:heavy metal translocating P-type ATPase [Thiomicrorhabdus sp. zzn3]|uniref:heavy metal translocating P-type ATPase n=1 Tax=Thiomicrorhabdus sp. zzn3 TaxID=3039775 RepID=UPI002436B79C|nr:heavy metal translocating P-type ATPase [Thiomicrorhabdus sp. zzn3]MDG6777266.1 heavy metal translocating P-type ATPase [Thiomicrorhabdus sp. zzn3]